ncbi:MAG: J domain-containing protein, partial [Pseudomonadota bacterium]|nr:J domain-containing protein [Pseudomonadota bacterium]
ILSWMRYRAVVLKRSLFALRSARDERRGVAAVARRWQMRRPRWEANHYDLLDVSKDATDLEIRSAYLRLIKERHPDREVQVTGTIGSAAELNAAYWVLRDPVRRARYDDALQEENRNWLYPRSAEPAPLAPIPSRRSRELLAAGALLTVITALVLFGQQQVAERERAAATAALSRPPLRIRTPTWLPPDLKTLNDSSVAEAASAATMMSPDEALEHSKSCFEEVAASRDLKILDYCVAFDASVALLDPTTAARGDKPSYFNPAVQQARHAEALFPFFKTEREAQARRLAVVAASVAQLAQKLSEQAGNGQSPAPERTGSRERPTDKREAR